MNVFEDLIVELKEENLLEETIFDIAEDEIALLTDFENEADSAEISTEASVVAPEIVGNDEASVPESKSKKKKKAKGSREFFKKRAVAEVSGLQMVEHVLTAVEREYMKVRPDAFDDFNVKRSLNAFLQLPDSDAEEHKKSEFELMQQTEAWFSALTVRDNNIPVQHLRQYCENTRPALSSQAMLALARFYRNSPYSEPVRAKFDFVITRLFSRPTGGERRKPLFSRDEALGHLNTLYREWSSVSLYTADDDLSKIALAALSFDDLMGEADNAAHFDDLIESDFFGRLRLFKESIAEMFFAPDVAIAAIEANIQIGNRYVKLIDLERQKADADVIQSRYGDLDSETISDAAARTLELVELLRSPLDVEEEYFEKAEEEPEPLERIILDTSTMEPEPEPQSMITLPGFLNNIKQNAFQVNRWLLAVSILLIAGSIGLYVWANFVADEKVPTTGVQAVNLDNAVFKEHIKSAKVAGETFHAVLLPSWNDLSKEKREEYLKKILQAGPSMNFKRVNLLKADGKQAGFASAARVDVEMP
ncbi:MAG: hypothetical protein WBD16_04455 [Pyrinomonadaceae bacterium]